MKIRTDFVTNSSSSSFVLVIRIGLKNGEVLKFIGDGGVGENDETYYQLAALKSPEELGQSESVEALIQALKESVVEPSPVRNGLRIGTTTCTQRGMGTEQMCEIADIIDRAARAPKDTDLLKTCAEDVRRLTDAFPLYGMFDVEGQ